MWIISISNGPGLDPLAGVEHLERRVADLVLLELRAHQPDRQRPAVDRRRHADLAQHVGQRADVVLVAVGEHDRLDVVGALAQVGEVGQHEVDPEHLGGREHQPGVDDDDPAVVLDDGHVLADLPQAPEREDAAPSRSRRYRAPLGDQQAAGARAPRGSRSRSLVGRRHHRQPHVRRRSRPSSSSAVFTGIGFAVTRHRLVDAASARRRSRRRARASPATAAS